MPSIILALGAQVIVLLALVLVRVLIPLQTPILLWILLQAIGAAALGRRWSLGPCWTLFQIALPAVLAWHMGHPVPLWVYPTLLAILLLVYGGGIFTKVPLYNSGLPAWKAIAGLIPESEEIKFVDLGAGLGGPLAYIAAHRPKAVLLGVEASPLVWLIGWLRTSRFRPRCSFRLDTIWKTDLRDVHIVYAFLSPAPMPELWTKVRQEMRPGSILISHSFEVPGQIPYDRIPLPGRKDSALLLYRIQ